MKINNQLRREARKRNKRKWGGVHGRSVFTLNRLPRVNRKARKKIRAVKEQFLEKGETNVV